MMVQLKKEKKRKKEENDEEEDTWRNNEVGETGKSSRKPWLGREGLKSKILSCIS
jgi:hypothetical protein